MHLNDGIGHHPKIRTVYNHNEQGCAIAAEAYARLTGRIGFPEAQWDSIASLPALEKACRKIRRDRLSVMRNPEQGIIAFAVPVFRSDGRVFSLGLTMPLMRCTSPVKRQILQDLSSHAEKLSV